ncbi:uncharacterized protein DUF3347 [Chitinophaga dinghuensis]|uniref:Uncharacterized protein DUF3347 n=1 Tax=Chitinophaga dinghuensis TaxID=1539050 RepID=A0A327W872_9BACT|nr:DUF3347 domain-containing protein [Chitinophaga dinghuensis]RAJ82238.1 uncharacterized protein DUF3347 [Chitinophaga dinghuensis]
MKNSISMIVLLAAVMLLAVSCGNKAVTAEVIADKKQDTSVAVVLKDDRLNAIYPQYVKLTKALTDNDAAAARIAANAIGEGVVRLQLKESMKQEADKIVATADIELQRKAFATLSKELIALIEQSGVQAGTLYVDFCPMAMEDNGASWISAARDIRNPYFGEKMLTCGGIKSTFAVNNN